MEDWAPGQFAEWWEIDWDDMPYAAQRAFETLGWTSKSWDPDDPTPCPESDNIPWAELNSVQQEAAAILGFDEAELGRRMKNEMKLPSNFERLVLGCIDSYDSDQRLKDFAAFFEIFKICIPLHRTDLKISARNRQNF